MTDGEMKNVLELALLTSQTGPLSARGLARMFADADIGEKRVRSALGDLSREWENRALELRETAGGFQFVSRGGGMEYLRRLSPRKPPRLSRPLTEILAFIAYRQPATRGDIEQVRGVAVSSQQIDTLEGYGWIEEVGRRETPGRPMLYATTKTFLDDLGLAKLDDLPALETLSESVDPENGVGAAEAENGAGEGGGESGENGENGVDGDNPDIAADGEAKDNAAEQGESEESEDHGNERQRH